MMHGQKNIKLKSAVCWLTLHNCITMHDKKQRIDFFMVSQSWGFHSVVKIPRVIRTTPFAI